jgi:hypothetical protein
MSLVEILPSVQSLPREDKLQLIHILTQELAEAEGPAELVPGQAYPVWSPFDAWEAAAKLEEFLRSEGRPAG